MNSKKVLLTISFISFILVIAGYLLKEDLRGGVIEVLSLILLISGYLSGFFAVFFGILFSVFYFIISLPLISVIYGWVLFTVSRIHYIIFTLIFRKLLHRMKWYRDLEFRVKNSEWYQGLVSSSDRIIKRLGLKSSIAMKIFHVNRCKNCGRIIPVDSKFCLYCGKKLT